MTQPEPNFTVDKIGTPWLEDRGHIGPDDLPPLLYIRWSAVNELQWQNPHCTIWLTFETIHVRNNGEHRSAHWADDDTLRSYCQ